MVNTFNSLEGNVHVHECGEVNGNYSGHSNRNNREEFYKKILGELDGLGNVKYTLRSDDSRTIRVPAKYAKNASKLVNFALECKEYPDFKTRILANDEFVKMYIPKCAGKIIGKGKKIGSKNSRKAIDEIYFSTCLYQCYNELAVNSGKERMNTINNIELFKAMLKSL